MKVVQVVVFAVAGATVAPTPSPTTPLLNCSLTQTYSDPVYVEVAGVGAIIDAVDLPVALGWQKLTDIPGSLGGGYIEWQGNTPYYGVCNCKKVSFRVKVDTPGRKRIRIHGYLGPDHENNDVFLRVSGGNYYGQRANTVKWPQGNMKCTDDATGAAVDCLPYVDGQSGLNYLKVYIQGKNNKWNWKTKTSDGDARDIFVDFDQPGVYRFQFSARSQYFPIDRIVVFDQPLGLSTNQVLARQNAAQAPSNYATKCA